MRADFHIMNINVPAGVCAPSLDTEYTENLQNICEGVFTNALQSCSKKLSCKQVIPSQMFVVTIMVVR